MSNPSGVTMATFEYVESSQYVILKGSVVLGQVQSASINSQINTRKIARIGDSSKSTAYDPVEHTGSFGVYSELDPDDLGRILGVTKPGSGGWAGTEVLKLDNTIAAADYYLDVYDGATGTGDVKVGRWTLDNLKPSTLQMQVQAGNDTVLTINFSCDAITYTPTAGVGA
jgi:hypothetical protein